MIAMKATARATRVKTADAAPAALDVMVGPADGMAGFKRIDCAVSRSPDGSLHVELDIPGKLAPSVAGLLAALGVKGQR
jgi:hypothetical protein